MKFKEINEVNEVLSDPENRYYWIRVWNEFKVSE